MSNTPKLRHWFTISLRELLLLVALVATGLGWYVDHKKFEGLAPLFGMFDQDIKANRVVKHWAEPGFVTGEGLGAKPGTSIVYKGRRFLVVADLKE